MKKWFGLTAGLAALCVAQTAFAAVTVSDFDADSAARILCTDMGTEGVGVSIYAPSAPETNPGSDPVYVKQTLPDGAGSYDVGFVLSGESGFYTVNVYDIAEEQAYEQKVFFANSVDYAAAIEGLNALKNGADAAIAEYIERNKNLLGFGGTVYEATNKNTTASLVRRFLAGNEFSTTDRTANLVEYRYLLAINGTASGVFQSLEDLAPYVQVMNEGALKPWMAESTRADYQSSVLDRLSTSGAGDAQTFEDKVIEAFVLAKVEFNDGYGEGKRIITEFQDKLGIVASDYSDNAYYTVSGNHYADSASLKSALDSANGSGSDNGGGSSGGSGSKGGSGGGKKSNSVGANVSVPAGRDDLVTVEPPETVIFSDLAGMDWAKEHVEKLYSKGIVNGDGAGSFLPNNPVTREEFVKMIVLAFDLYDETAEASFADVPKEEWYYSYVASAVKNGVVNGFDEQTFGTGSQITREDMAVIAYRAAKGAGKAVDSDGEAITFADGASIADYAQDSVTALTRCAVINGIDGSFCPKDNSTRAQAAVVISRLLDLTDGE